MTFDNVLFFFLPDYRTTGTGYEGGTSYTVCASACTGHCRDEAIGDQSCEEECIPGCQCSVNQVIYSGHLNIVGHPGFLTPLRYIHSPAQNNKIIIIYIDKGSNITLCDFAHYLNLYPRINPIDISTK